MKFTGIKDIDYKILNELDDNSLINFCKTNKFATKLCNDDEFWKRRIYHIFKYNVDEILKIKTEESFKDFYINKISKRRSMCLNIPKSSQMAIDDFYNPKQGFINAGYTRDLEGIDYLLLKIILERVNKEGLNNEKMVNLLNKIKKEIPEYRLEEFDTDNLDLTDKEKLYFYNLINIPLGRAEILKSYARVNPASLKRLKNAPEIFKYIAFIHNGFKDKKIPLDIKWDELCIHPYLYTEKLIF